MNMKIVNKKIGFWRSIFLSTFHVCEIIFEFNFQNLQLRLRQRKFSVGVGGVRRFLETFTNMVRRIYSIGSYYKTLEKFQVVLEDIANCIWKRTSRPFTMYMNYKPDIFCLVTVGRLLMRKIFFSVQKLKL